MFRIREENPCSQENPFVVWADALRMRSNPKDEDTRNFSCFLAMHSIRDNNPFNNPKQIPDELSSLLYATTITPGNYFEEVRGPRA